MKTARNKGRLVWLIVVALAVFVAVAVGLVLVFNKPSSNTDESTKESAAVVDTVPPVIEGEEIITVYKNDKLDDSFLLGHFEIHDDAGQVINKVVGECDTTVIQNCAFKITAEDSAGNVATKEVVVKVEPSPWMEKYGKSEYFVRVNRLLNVVMVYALGEDGEYNNLAKTFVASTGAPGTETPLGNFTVSDRFEALYLVGYVWGRYAVRIEGPFFFHSVPYFTKGNPQWDNLEYLEYNKLGEGASAGCVRLAVKDAKWVYENIAAGTGVEIYDAEVLPDGVVKPVALKIDENSPNRGWDPTDTEKPE